MNTKKLGMAMVATLSLVGVVSAATIGWSAASALTEGDAKNTLSAGLFDASGTLVLADNVGGSATIHDGINFADGSIAFTGEASVFHAKTELSKTGTYSASNTVGTVNLSDLTIGQAYRIQALVYDGRADVGIPGRTVAFDGINQGQYANGVYNVTWGDGLLVTGIFTANAATQDFTIEAFLGADSKGGQLNALTLHAIPEPATLGLVAIFGGGVMFIRRRMMV